MDPMIVFSGLAGCAALGFGVGAALRTVPAMRMGAPAPPSAESRKGAFAATAKRGSSIVALYRDALRHADGGFTRIWRYPLASGFLPHDVDADRRCDGISRMLAAPKPPGTVMSFRLSCLPADPGCLRALYARRSSDRPDAVQRLDDLENAHLAERIQAGAFRRTDAVLSMRVPSGKRQPLLDLLDDLGWRHHRDHPMARLVAEETNALRAAERAWRTVENESPFALERLGGRELFETLFHAHRLTATSSPRLRDYGCVDLRSFLTVESVEHGPWYALVGEKIPTAMISLFTPPQPDITAATLRGLTAHPGLTFPHTVVAEFVHLDPQDAKGRLDKRRNQIRRANTAGDGSYRPDIESQLADKELVEVRAQSARPDACLVKTRFYIVVHGDPAASRSALSASLKELEARCEVLVACLRGLEGADAEVEREGALRELFRGTFLGEASERDTGREHLEVSQSLCCLVPTEDAWRGTRADPHCLLTTASGRLLPYGLFDFQIAPSPVVLLIGAPGCGKTFAMISLVRSFLANVPKGRVWGCDFGNGLGPLAALVNGLQVRFEPDSPRPLNIWAYPELDRGVPPDEQQVELVVQFYLLLAGVPETDPAFRHFRTVLALAVREVYGNEVPRNRNGQRHEPILSDLLTVLDTYPFDQVYRTTLAELLNALEAYRDNPWLDRQTFDGFDNRFVIFELDSLDRFPRPLQIALSFAAVSRVVGSMADANPDGTRNPQIQIVEEYWKFRDLYPHTAFAIDKAARQGRAAFTRLLLLSHSYRDFEGLPGILQAAATRFIGLQRDDCSDLVAANGLSREAEAAIGSLRNVNGELHQFLLSVGNGPDQVNEVVSYSASPVGLWTATTQRPEVNARTRAAHLRPDLSLGEIISWLARRYPRGLVREALTGIDENALLSE